MVKAWMVKWLMLNDAYIRQKLRHQFFWQKVSRLRLLKMTVPKYFVKKYNLIMTLCLFGASHCLTQWWLIVNWNNRCRQPNGCQFVSACEKSWWNSHWGLHCFIQCRFYSCPVTTDTSNSKMVSLGARQVQRHDVDHAQTHKYSAFCHGLIIVCLLWIFVEVRSCLTATQYMRIWQTLFK